MNASNKDAFISNEIKLRNALVKCMNKRQNKIQKIQDELLTRAKSKNVTNYRPTLSYYNIAKEIQEQYTTQTTFLKAINKIDQITLELNSQRRQLIEKNKALKAELREKEMEKLSMKCRIIVLNEKGAYYKFMNSLQKYKFQKEVAKTEFYVWNQCIYDKFWTDLSSFQPHFYHIMHLKLAENTQTKSLIDFTKSVVLKSQSKASGTSTLEIYQKSICLMLVAKVCLDDKQLVDAVYFCKEAITTAYQLININPIFVGKCFLCMSMLSLKFNQNSDQSHMFLHKAFTSFKNGRTKHNNEKIKKLIAQNYINFAYLIGDTVGSTNALRYFESGIATLSCLLPFDKFGWISSLLSLATLFNQKHLFNDSMQICKILIDFSHDNQKLVCKTNHKSIFDIAFRTQETMNLNSSDQPSITVQIPKILNKPPIYIRQTAAQLIVSCSLSRQYFASEILYKWLTQPCMTRANINSKRNKNKSKPKFISVKIKNLKIRQSNNMRNNLFSNYFGCNNRTNETVVKFPTFKPTKTVKKSLSSKVIKFIKTNKKPVSNKSQNVDNAVIKTNKCTKVKGIRTLFQTFKENMLRF